MVSGGGLDAESRGKNGETPFPVLKGKVLGKRKVLSGAAGIVLPGINGLGSSKNNFKFEK